MEPRKKIALIYHSGSGGTKILMAEFQKRLAPFYDTVLYEAHMRDIPIDFFSIDLFLFGFPVFYLKPTPAIVEFVNQLPVFPRGKAAFVFVTKSIISQNTIRLFAKTIKRKKILLSGWAEFQAPSTDLSLILSYKVCQALFDRKSSLIYGYEKNITEKIDLQITKIHSILAERCLKSRKPRLKWYTPMMWPMQRLYFDGFDKHRDHLRILPERCNQCRWCVEVCRMKAWSDGADGLRHDPEKCECCMGCLHGCPVRAISVSEATKDHPRLDQEFYQQVRERFF